MQFIPLLRFAVKTSTVSNYAQSGRFDWFVDQRTHSTVRYVNDQTIKLALNARFQFNNNQYAANESHKPAKNEHIDGDTTKIEKIYSVTFSFRTQVILNVNFVDNFLFVTLSFMRYSLDLICNVWSLDFWLESNRYLQSELCIWWRYFTFA